MQKAPTRQRKWRAGNLVRVEGPEPGLFTGLISRESFCVTSVNAASPWASWVTFLPDIGDQDDFTHVSFNHCDNDSDGEQRQRLLAQRRHYHGIAIVCLLIIKTGSIYLNLQCVPRAPPSADQNNKTLLMCWGEDTHVEPVKAWPHLWAMGAKAEILYPLRDCKIWPGFAAAQPCPLLPMPLPIHHSESNRHQIPCESRRPQHNHALACPIYVTRTAKRRSHGSQVKSWYFQANSYTLLYTLTKRKKK